ncbi:MAG TPA: hypothetical protein EYG72_01605 [Candidatus Pacebacteria bacterium]|nr:hypothetical protein [Candidatus Paceibacterota bacterium]
MAECTVRGKKSFFCDSYRGVPSEITILIISKTKTFFAEDDELIKFMKKSRKKVLSGQYGEGDIFNTHERDVLKIMFPKLELSSIESSIVKNIAELLEVDIFYRDEKATFTYTVDLEEINKK